MQWLPCTARSHGAPVVTARFGHSATSVDSSPVWGTELVVVFGGVSYTEGAEAAEQHAALDDVLVLQTEADTWFVPQFSSASAPEARAFHSAAMVDRKLYIFGGHVLSFDAELNKKKRHFFNDVWCLDTDTWTWTALHPEGEGPSKRDMATMTHAGGNCLVLFGGRNESGRAAGDAWVLDLNKNAWSLLKVSGPSPPARKMHSAVYATGRVVLFGGERDAGVLDDLWTLKGADGSEPCRWTQIKLRPAPQGRFGHHMAASGSSLMVFGGCLDQSSLLSFSRSYVQCSELWLLDLASFSWSRADGAEGSGAPRPADRMCHTLSPLSGGRVLLMGGRKKEGICDDTWWLLKDGEAHHNRTPSLTVAPTPPALSASSSQASLLQSLLNPLKAPPQTSSSPTPKEQHDSPATSPRASASAAAAGPGSSLLSSDPSTPNSTGKNVSPHGSQSNLVPLAGPPAAASSGSLTAMKGRVADKASTALNKLSNTVTSTVSSLLSRVDDVARQPSGPGQGSALPSPSLLARLRHGPGLLGGVTQPQPALLGAAPGAVNVLSSGASAASEYQQLRQRLGLSLVPPPPDSSTNQDSQVTLQALASFGQQVASLAANASNPHQAAAITDAAAVGAARAHLSSLVLERLPLGQLPLILADCQMLARADCADVWGRVAGAGGGDDLGVLLTHVSATSTLSLSLQLDQLRMSDVGPLLAEYRRLCLGGQLQSQEAAA